MFAIGISWPEIDPEDNVELGSLFLSLIKTGRFAKDGRVLIAKWTNENMRRIINTPFTWKKLHANEEYMKLILWHCAGAEQAKAPIHTSSSEQIDPSRQFRASERFLTSGKEVVASAETQIPVETAVSEQTVTSAQTGTSGRSTAEGTRPGSATTEVSSLSDWQDKTK
jgi:hypothetical protein